MKNILFGMLMLSLQSINAQLIATLEVKMTNDPLAMSFPVQVNLDAITFLPDSVLQLVEVRGTARIPVAYQVEYTNQRNLYWIIESNIKTSKSKIFELRSHKPEQAIAIQANARDGILTIHQLNKKYLQYNYKTVYPPAGIDTAYRRSGFIHPLWSPRGQELTQVNAPDHYHHWGLWNPWTHVLFKNDTVDFWNLAKKQGTVRFGNFISTTSGGVFAGFKSLHEHVVFKNGKEEVAINELQTVKVYKPAGNQNYFIADITVQLNCADSVPVLLLEYRYGGLGLRATKDWNNINSKIITSEGKSRKEADGTTARWVMVQGEVSGDYAGLVMMSFPTNYNYPEPLRVWPEDMNKRGDVFLNFSPTKNKNWLLEPGKEYALSYRLLIFNDSFSKESADKAWQHFATPPMILIKKQNKQ